MDTHEREICPNYGLEIYKTPTIRCPVRGIIFVTDCCKAGPYRERCQFYGGKRGITDLSGEDYEIVICKAEELRKQIANG